MDILVDTLVGGYDGFANILGGCGCDASGGEEKSEVTNNLDSEGNLLFKGGSPYYNGSDEDDDTDVVKGGSETANYVFLGFALLFAVLIATAAVLIFVTWNTDGSKSQLWANIISMCSIFVGAIAVAAYNMIDGRHCINFNQNQRMSGITMLSMGFFAALIIALFVLLIIFWAKGNSGVKKAVNIITVLVPLTAMFIGVWNFYEKHTC